jgi:hypothetical protein
VRFTLALLAAALAACADIGPRPRSEAPGLEAAGDMAGINVEMESEEVTLVLSRWKDKPWVERLAVEATFTMRNTGEDASFEEGFPIGPVKNMREFRATADGAAVEARLIDRFEGARRPVTEEAADAYDETGRHDYWYVWDAKYAAGATRTVRVTFALELFSYGNFRGASYVLETGARWKGRIGRATVTIRFGDGLSAAHVTSALPCRGASVVEGGLAWTFADLEPGAEDNVSVSYHNARTWEEIVGGLRAEAKDHWSARKELVAMLRAAPGRRASEILDAAEFDAWIAALAGMLDDAKDADGRLTLPAGEPERLTIGEDVSPAVREQLLRDRATEIREYARPGEAGLLFVWFDAVLDGARSRPGHAGARDAAARWAAVAERFLKGEVYAGESRLEFPRGAREEASAALRRKIEEAQALK